MNNKRKPSKTKFLTVFAITVACLSGLQSLCHFQLPPYPAPSTSATSTTDIADSLDYEIIDTIPQADEPSEALSYPADTVANAPVCNVDSTRDKVLEQPEDSSGTTSVNTLPVVPRNVRLGSHLWSYDECFPDVQDVQLAAANHNGIHPAQTREDLSQMVRQRKLVNVSCSPFYVIEDLSHSTPYLVPKAQQLLNTIAVNFIDSVQSKGLEPHMIVVSSVTRSVEDVVRLQHGNPNATTNSCHCYGTTIDIAYHRFMPIQGNIAYNAHLQQTKWNDDLKFILGEVLYDLRNQGKCYVKYERKQACFHLTVR